MNEFNEKLLVAIRYFIFVSRVIYKNESWVYLLTVFLELFSKVFVFVSFILPIKILLMLGSDNKVGKYFSGYFEIKEDFVYFLAVLTVVFFVAGKVAGACSERLKAKINENLGSGLCFTKKVENRLKAVVDKNTMVMSSGVYVVIALVVVMLLYEDLVFIVLGFLLLGYLIILFSVEYCSSMYEYIIKKPDKYFDMIANLCFFVVFFYIIYDVTVGSEKMNVIAFIAGIILCRQICMSKAQVLLGVRRIYLDKHVVKNVFLLK